MGWLFGNSKEKRRYNLYVLLFAIFFFVALGGVFLLSNSRSPLAIFVFTILFVSSLFALAVLGTKARIEYYRYLFYVFRKMLSRDKAKKVNISFEKLRGVDSRGKLRSFIQILRRRLRERCGTDPTHRQLCERGDVVIVEYVIGTQRIYLIFDFRKYQVKIEYKGDLCLCQALNDDGIVDKVADTICEIYRTE
jgi:hypothetical protein